MRSWRQNIIVSHGGKHGTTSRTFRKGASVAPDAAALVPDAVLGQATVPAAAEPEAPRIAPRGHEPGDRPAVKKLAQAAMAEHGEARGGPHLDEDSEDAQPHEGDIADPDAKRTLALMRKSEIEALAAKHGIEVEAGLKGRTQMLRDLIAAKLGL